MNKNRIKVLANLKGLSLSGKDITLLSRAYLENKNDAHSQKIKNLLSKLSESGQVAWDYICNKNLNEEEGVIEGILIHKIIHHHSSISLGLSEIKNILSKIELTDICSVHDPYLTNLFRIDIEDILSGAVFGEVEPDAIQDAIDCVRTISQNDTIVDEQSLISFLERVSNNSDVTIELKKEVLICSEPLLSYGSNFLYQINLLESIIDNYNGQKNSFYEINKDYILGDIDSKYYCVISAITNEFL